MTLIIVHVTHGCKAKKELNEINNVKRQNKTTTKKNEKKKKKKKKKQNKIN